MTEVIYTNARIVAGDHQYTGSVCVADGLIKATDAGRSTLPSAIDLEGDYLLPGLVELHTDHYEQHLRPRPSVRWPEVSALMAFDAQIAAAGITTVFDCVRAGKDADYTPELGEIAGAVSAIRECGAAGILRAEHHLHVRCEICTDEVVAELEEMIESGPVGLISLMDHTPGARQFSNIDIWKLYYGGKSGRTEAQLQALIHTKREQYARNYKTNRETLLALARARGLKVASHDDATEEHVAESIADQVSIAEFPTTELAAERSHAAGIGVLMGAPNVVRGGSHSGNVAAEALARLGVLDILSSDYVPASLLYAAFELDRRIEGYGLTRALDAVTRNPAKAAGFDDRGEIAVGKRADLIRVKLRDRFPIVRETYRGGTRVL